MEELEIILTTIMGIETILLFVATMEELEITLTIIMGIEIIPLFVVIMEELEITLTIIMGIGIIPLLAKIIKVITIIIMERIEQILIVTAQEQQLKKLLNIPLDKNKKAPTLI
jgi:predicted membrane channel-forming protein YqfA (hemolysin III family)